jgi:hypothetical protein
MALRFRKSIKLAPGIRMNFSGSGASWTLGPRGASVGIGHRGTYLNTGIPGTGLSSRQRLSGGATSPPRPRSSGTTEMAVSVSISDDGVLTFKDAQGNTLPNHLINTAKKQQGDKIKGLIQSKCDEINGQIEALGKIHEYTSPPVAHVFQAKVFDEPAPPTPPLKQPGFFCRLFKSCVEKVNQANEKARLRHTEEMAEWKLRKDMHKALQQAEAAFLEKLNAGDPHAIEQHFESVLQDITWPKETLVTFEIPAPGILAVDVDLPEIEDMPNKTAAVPQRGLKLSVKEIGATHIQKLYMRHIHGIGFRIAGEAFAASPTISMVVLSAYSQRADKATGNIIDQYLYSARIPREQWLAIDFDNLEQIEVTDALERFELRRTMTKTGIFKPIEPFDAQAQP